LGRSILVGDVHGCADELGDLLDRVSFGDDDRLWLVGDLVARGPQPARVLEMVRELGGRSVMGNHEHRLLAWRALREGKQPPEGLAGSTARLLDSPVLPQLAQQIDEPGWLQIEQLPLWLQLDEHRLLIVHAGLQPGLDLAAQQAKTLLYARCLDQAGRPLIERDSGPLWGTSYGGPPHVVFGHNALAEPQLHDWATGIDTGCVYGGRLTALVLDRGEVLPKDKKERAQQLQSVPARSCYCPTG